MVKDDDIRLKYQLGNATDNMPPIIPTTETKAMKAAIAFYFQVDKPISLK